MDNLVRVNNFLNELEDKNIYYRLNKIRKESIMVEVVLPGQRWEVEFMEDGTVEIEKFISDGTIFGADQLKMLIDDFSNADILKKR